MLVGQLWGQGIVVENDFVTVTDGIVLDYHFTDSIVQLGGLYNVSLFYRLEKDKRWILCETVKRDVGERITVEGNKKVYWKILKDLPNGVEGEVALRVEGRRGRVGEMVFVEGGIFSMGCMNKEDCRDDEKPDRQVSVEDFYIGKYEVTFDEYDAFCNATGRGKARDWDWGRGELPVIDVSWYDAIEYCNWLSHKEGLDMCYQIDKETKDLNNNNKYDDLKWRVHCDFNKNGYRLPTEAEWEYAARGGQASKGYKWAGVGKEEDLFLFGNYFEGDTNHLYTAIVGSYKSNELGLYDMSGNVWEWCWDWFGPYALKEGLDIYRNIQGSVDGENRVLRSGSWLDKSSTLRVVNRRSSWPDNHFDCVGFRIARMP